MDMKKIWREPSQEEQDGLRSRFSAAMDRHPMPRNKVAKEASLSPSTVEAFASGKKLEWVSFKKLSLFVDKMEKRL